jgi:hypothetical protein
MMMLAAFAYKGKIDTPADRAVIGLLGGLLWRLRCRHEMIQMGALRQVFFNWAGKHPEQWPKARVFGVRAVLREAWPCKR